MKFCRTKKKGRIGKRKMTKINKQTYRFQYLELIGIINVTQTDKLYFI